MAKRFAAVVVLARDASGKAGLHKYAPVVTRAQHDKGYHFRLAKKKAAAAGLREPMVAFNAHDGIALARAEREMVSAAAANSGRNV